AGTLEIEPTPSRLDELFETFSTYDEDFVDVRGQQMAKRAIAIAAAGAHNLLILCPTRPHLGRVPQTPCFSGPNRSHACCQRLVQPAILVPISGAKGSNSREQAVAI
ncbi:MAG: ATP-binding protein, partial [Pirellulaceae bacterium]|nr:ATP-binding protein [Pirellulaceae bacterium]